MARTFSATNQADVDALVLDQAPGAPTFFSQPKYVGGNVEFDVSLPMTDHDGTPLTGLNELHVFAANRDAAGISPLDGLGGQQLMDASFNALPSSIAITQEQALTGVPIKVSFPWAANPAGIKTNVVIVVSDGTA